MNARQIKWTAALCVMVLCLTSLAGCNTMRGFGKDLSKVGQKIEGAATK